MDLKRLFRRKPSAELGKGEKDLPSSRDTARAQMPYLPSPSALKYPGVKAEEKLEPAMKPSPAAQPKSVQSGLPRCPECGWSIGFTDEKCPNCGHILIPRL